jgi:biopolymer transport protein ExbB/TolQ
MAISDAGQWTIFGVLSIVILVLTVLWVQFLPRYKQYKQKIAKLDSLNSQYEELRRRRKDLVFHFFWSVDSGNMKEADEHERDVLDIDKKLKSIRESYSGVERGA